MKGMEGLKLSSQLGEEDQEMVFSEWKDLFFLYPIKRRNNLT
jgi:hypothetical protein